VRVTTVLIITEAVDSNEDQRGQYWDGGNVSQTMRLSDEKPTATQPAVALISK